MEFWGVEVKAGAPLKCDPGFKTYVHLSQASLGEVKKDHRNDLIPIFVEVNGQKLVLGTLSPDKCSQILFDLIFEKEFTLSHNWKNGSVYFCGYKSVQEDPTTEDFTDTDSDSEEEDHPLVVKEGKPEVKEEKPKPVADKANAAKLEPKPNVKQAELKKGKDEEDDDDDDEDESEDEDSDDEDMIGVGDDSDDDEDEDDESSEEEEEAIAKKAEKDKKRPAESTMKTPVPEKKAKLVSPSGQKKVEDGKKGAHMATPHPSKKGGKTPASNDKSKPQTPKSGGQVTCKSCNRTFNSENALDSHTKAKHSTGK